MNTIVQDALVQFRTSHLTYNFPFRPSLFYGTEATGMYNTSIMFLWHLLLRMCNKYKMKMLQGYNFRNIAYFKTFSKEIKIHLGLVQTSNFSCVESNVNELEQRMLICIKFGTFALDSAHFLICIRFDT